MKALALTPLLTLLLGAPALCDRLAIEVQGTVLDNQLQSGPFVDSIVGEEVQLAFEVEVPGTLFPLEHLARHEVTPASLTIGIGGVFAGMTADATLQLDNDVPDIGIGDHLVFPAAELDVPGPGSNALYFGVSDPTGALFPSLVLEDAIAVYDDSLFASQSFYVRDESWSKLLVHISGFSVREPNPGWIQCTGDGSGLNCPCGNLGGAGEGCRNSSGVGASLMAHGSSWVALDDLRFEAHGLVAGSASLLFVGTSAAGDGLGVVFGDGLRCAGGTLGRLGVRQANSAGGALWAAGMAERGAWLPGDVRHFQVWYRDIASSPCNTAFNTTNGLGIEFR